MLCNNDVLKTINFFPFDPHMRHSRQIWGQSQSKIFNIIQCAKNQALRIISFKQFMEPSEPLFNQLKINSSKNIILNNHLFVFDKLNNFLPDVFYQFFKPFTELHNQTIRGSKQYSLNVPKTNNQMFGSNSIKNYNIKKIISKVHFSPALLLKHNRLSKLVKSTFFT